MKMKKFFRIEQRGASRHVIEEDGGWRLLEGDLFGRYEAGDSIAMDGQTLLVPVMLYSSSETWGVP